MHLFIHPAVHGGMEMGLSNSCVSIHFHPPHLKCRTFIHPLWHSQCLYLHFLSASPSPPKPRPSPMPLITPCSSIINSGLPAGIKITLIGWIYWPLKVVLACAPSLYHPTPPSPPIRQLPSYPPCTPLSPFSFPSGKLITMAMQIKIHITSFYFVFFISFFLAEWKVKSKFHFLYLVQLF